MENVNNSLPLNSGSGNEIFYNCLVCDCIFDDEICFESHSQEHLLNSSCKVSFDPPSYSNNADGLEAADPVCGMCLASNDCIKSDSGVSTSCNDKKYACTVCTKKFKRRDHLNKHLVTHSGAKPFKCLICSKSYARKDRFKEHCTVIHSLTGWTCDFCGQMFPQRCILRKHELIHWGIKPFSCSFCCKQFSRKNDLMRHWTSHTGEKPYLCHICNKRFSQKRLLNRHSSVHSKNPVSKI